MTEISYAGMASLASERYRRLLKSSPGKKVDFGEILEGLYGEYGSKLDCNNVHAFKSTVSSIVQSRRKSTTKNLVSVEEQAQEQYVPADEGDGLQFVFNQIDKFGLNPDSYY